MFAVGDLQKWIIYDRYEFEACTGCDYDLPTYCSQQFHLSSSMKKDEVTTNRFPDDEDNCVEKRPYIHAAGFLYSEAGRGSNTEYYEDH